MNDTFFSRQNFLRHFERIESFAARAAYERNQKTDQLTSYLVPFRF